MLKSKSKIKHIIRYVYYCDICSCIFDLSTNIHNNIQLGKPYVHAKCRMTINKNNYKGTKQ